MQAETIRGPLQALHSRALSFYEVDVIIRVFHGLALAYIGRKVSAGRLDTGRLGMSLEDLAVDCIAELFSRDEQGRFCALLAYFSKTDFDTVSDDELLGLCRRLAFSAVNQQLFRVYGTYDPAFRKLLRNLKGAARRAPGMGLVDRHGETWLLFSADGVTSDIRPVIPPELLESCLVHDLSVRSSSADMLRSVGAILVDRPEYMSGYPLVGLTSVLRRMLARMDIIDDPKQDDGVSVEEIDLVIKEALQSVRAETGDRYVRDGKLNDGILDAYQRTVQEILLMEFGSGNGSGVSYGDILSTVLPGVTPEEYTARHRSRVEYLVRIARREFLKRIQAQL